MRHGYASLWDLGWEQATGNCLGNASGKVETWMSCFVGIVIAAYLVGSVSLFFIIGYGDCRVQRSLPSEEANKFVMR